VTILIIRSNTNTNKKKKKKKKKKIKKKKKKKKKRKKKKKKEKKKKRERERERERERGKETWRPSYKNYIYFLNFLCVLVTYSSKLIRRGRSERYCRLLLRNSHHVMARGNQGCATSSFTR